MVREIESQISYNCLYGKFKETERKKKGMDAML